MYYSLSIFWISVFPLHSFAFVYLVHGTKYPHLTSQTKAIWPLPLYPQLRALLHPFLAAYILPSPQPVGAFPLK